MMKWKIATALGVAFGVAGVSWGYAQRSQAPGFFELRVYTAQPGKRDALAERFASRTAAIFARHGITNVGYWIPVQSDPEFNEVVRKAEGNPATKLIVKAHNIDMVPHGPHTTITLTK